MIEAISSAPYPKKCEEKEKDFLSKSFYVIENIFDASIFQQIPEWCKNLVPYEQFSSTDKLYHNPRNQIYTSITFDHEHKIVDRNSYFKKGIPSSSEKLNDFVCVFVELFAQHLKLTGKNKIHVNLYRIKYVENTSIYGLQLDWHFDRFAKTTLAAVLQNDFSYKGGETAGLDLAENQHPGPHHPLYSDSHEFQPKNGRYISCPYLPNGAIIFHGNQGKIIHRRSLLKKPCIANATRTLLQIKLKDPDWIETKTIYKKL